MTASLLNSPTSLPQDGAPARRQVPDSVKTQGPRVRAWAAEYGLHCMPWQALVVDDMLGVRADRRWAARDSGLAVPRQNGKALDVSTPLLTANRGWVTMGDVQVGDLVFQPGGNTTPVVKVSDVMLGRDCYQVVTTDGRSVVADAEHLWTVVDKRREVSSGRRGEPRVRRFVTRTLTTREMFKSGTSRYASGGRTTTTGGKRYAANEYRYLLPVQEPLKSDDVQLPIDPYLFGAWLGDGHSRGAVLTSHVDDAPHWFETIRSAGFTPTVRSDRRPQVRHIGITSPGAGKRQRSLSGKLRALGVLEDKHVPDLYLTAGTAQREALLQGMLDTDGTIDARRGQVEFCSTSRRLADAALFLARSLGWRATLVEHRATIAGVDHGPKYRVCFTVVRTDPFVPFRLPRKVARIKAADGNAGRSTVSIRSVEPVPSRPVRCITVEAEDGLFLAGRDLLATHNSVVAELRILAGLYLFQEELIVYTAHQVDTALEIFERVVSRIEANPDLKRRMIGRPRRARGSEQLTLEAPDLPGGKQRLLIKARSKGGVRGFSADTIFLDEAQLGLDEEEMAALGPTQRTRPNPQTLFMGTPPLDPGTYWARVRKRGLAGDPKMSWHEWSPPEKYDADDRAVWRATNPALAAGMITEEDIEYDRKTLGSKFDADALGVWPKENDEAGWGVFKEDDWKAAQDPETAIEGQPVYAVESSRDLSSISIVAAGERKDRQRHVELVDRFPTDVGKLIGQLKKRIAKFDPLGIVVDPSGPAGYLINDIQKHCDVDVVKPSSRDVAAACGAFYVGISHEDGDERNIKVRPHPTLDAAARAAVWRDRADAKIFDRRNEEAPDVAPIVAAALADWGYQREAMSAWAFFE